VAVTFL
jgi:hypothetical protein